MKKNLVIGVLTLLSGVLVLCSVRLNRIIEKIPTLPEGEAQKNAQKNAEIYSRIDQYLIIEKHFLDKDISENVLARRLGVKKTVLNKMLRAKFNVAFHGYINTLRIGYSKKLLLDPRNLLIEVIAEECCFNCIRSFEYNFKKLNKITPSEYRRTYSRGIKSN